jgi:rSAM/selenodomain-associated transferase 2
MRETISIVIPTYNEAPVIERLLSHLRSFARETEIVVADGGSEDDTVAVASQLATVVRGARGRAVQMNAGASAAAGAIVWFLHADCWPSEKSCVLIAACMRDPEVVGGGFRWALSGGRWQYDLVTRVAHLKNGIRRELYGDMGIFVRRSVFEELGGYAEIPIFEEVELHGRLRTRGKTVLLDEALYSSDRRFVKEGFARTLIRNQVLKTLYRLGVAPERLKKHY